MKASLAAMRMSASCRFCCDAGNSNWAGLGWRAPRKGETANGAPGKVSSDSRSRGHQWGADSTFALSCCRKAWRLLNGFRLLFSKSVIVDSEDIWKIYAKDIGQQKSQLPIKS